MTTDNGHRHHAPFNCGVKENRSLGTKVFHTNPNGLQQFSSYLRGQVKWSHEYDVMQSAHCRKRKSTNNYVRDFRNYCKSECKRLTNEWEQEAKVVGSLKISPQRVQCNNSRNRFRESLILFVDFLSFKDNTSQWDFSCAIL